MSAGSASVMHRIRERSRAQVNGTRRGHASRTRSDAAGRRQCPRASRDAWSLTTVPPHRPRGQADGSGPPIEHFASRGGSVIRKAEEASRCRTGAETCQLTVRFPDRLQGTAGRVGGRERRRLYAVRFPRIGSPPPRSRPHPRNLPVTRAPGRSSRIEEIADRKKAARRPDLVVFVTDQPPLPSAFPRVIHVAVNPERAPLRARAPTPTTTWPPTGLRCLRPPAAGHRRTARWPAGPAPKCRRRGGPPGAQSP